MLQHEPPPEPWHSFFKDLDSALPERITLHCFGGFVINACYGFPRQTSDVDFLSIAPTDQRELVLKLGGEGSDFHKKHGVFLQHVTISNVPDSYEDRLNEMFPGAYPNIRLLALDPYDLALSKLDRNIQIDRDDVKYLVEHVPLTREILQDRYEQELRPVFIGRVEQADATITLWIEAFFPR